MVDANPSLRRATPRQRAYLYGLAELLGWDADEYCRSACGKAVEELTMQQATTIALALQSLRDGVQR